MSRTVLKLLLTIVYIFTIDRGYLSLTQSFWEPLNSYEIWLQETRNIYCVIWCEKNRLHMSHQCDSQTDSLSLSLSLHVGR